MSHLAPIAEYKCQACRQKKARYELINDRSACIGRYCEGCGRRKLYEFQHPQPARTPEQEANHQAAQALNRLSS